MILSELKQIIEDQDLEFPNDLIIFVNDDDTFLANQYTDAICARKSLQKNIINSLEDIDEKSALALVFNFTAKMNVLRVEEFAEICEDYSALQNVIIICNKVSKDIEKQVKQYIIKLPKLKDWQVMDYLKLKYKGLSDELLTWLYKVTKGNIYRLENELSKLLLFTEEERQDILLQLKNDKYSDLFAMDYFELPTAIYLNNANTFRTIASYLLHRDLVDLDPISLTVQLLNKYKQCLFLVKNAGSGISYEDLGMSKGAAYYATKEAPNISETSLKNKIAFLSGIDSKLKKGEIDNLPKEQFIDYIICNVMAL